MKNGIKCLLGLCAVFSLSARAQFFPIPAGAVPYGNDRRSLTQSAPDFSFSDTQKQLLVGITASAALPAYSFPGTGNNDNGLWRSGTDEISLVTAGQNRLTIGSTGVISFGTSIAPFLPTSGGTMTGGLTVLGGVTSQGFYGPVVGPVTGSVTGASSLNVLKAGDTMTGALLVTDTSGASIHSLGSIKAAQDVFAGQIGAGTGGKFRVLCDSGSECWRVGPGGSSGAVDLEFRSVLGGIVPVSISTAGTTTFSFPIQSVGGTMSGSLRANGGIVSAAGVTVASLNLNGSTSGSVRLVSPAVAGSQVYTLPTSVPPVSDSYLMGGTTGVLNWYVAPTAEIFVTSANGYGTTNAVIRRWTTIQRNNGGTAITLTPSAANGDSFVINETGTYAMTACDQFNGASNVGISLNSSQLTTGIQSMNVADIVCGANQTSANFGACCSATLALNSGDVIRVHESGTASGSNVWIESFRIRKLGP